jgi:hypothetical protein
MVSGDVFRSPKDTMLLCVQLGSGVQIILSSFITLFFAALGAPLLIAFSPKTTRGVQQSALWSYWPAALMRVP